MSGFSTGFSAGFGGPVAPISTIEGLTTLEALKTELNIDAGDTTQDVYLNGVILQMSSMIETYLDRVLGYGSFIQKKTFSNGKNLPTKIFLTKYPIVAVDEVSLTDQDGTKTVVDPSYYYFEEADGILTFTSPGVTSLHTGLADAISASALGSGYLTIAVDHNGGYDLPGSTDTAADDLPKVIERACLDLSKNAYYTKNQNPAVKSEMVPDVLQQTFFQPEGTSSFSTGVLNTLDSYLDLRQTF